MQLSHWMLVLNPTDKDDNVLEIFHDIQIQPNMPSYKPPHKYS